jgi:DNA-binding response OmpR family regulator
MISANLDSRARILIVDDIEDNRNVLERYLTSAGFATTVCASGREAIASISTAKPDMVLLDWMMPELSGLETLAAIREMHDSVRLPVIMCTAIDEDSSVVNAINTGANDYVTKPISRTILLARMSVHLKQHAIVKDIDEQRRDAQRRLEDQTRALFDSFRRDGRRSSGTPNSSAA